MKCNAFKNTIILFVCPPKILLMLCFQTPMAPTEIENNTYVKFWMENKKCMYYDTFKSCLLMRLFWSVLLIK